MARRTPSLAVRVSLLGIRPRHSRRKKKLRSLMIK
jgi:hypothetical protein